MVETRRDFLMGVALGWLLLGIGGALGFILPVWGIMLCGALMAVAVWFNT